MWWNVQEITKNNGITESRNNEHRELTGYFQILVIVCIKYII